MAAHFKLTEEDDGFLAAPQGASLLFSGASGTETWIERAADVVVRIGIKSVGVATDVGDHAAKGQDGPAPIEYRLSASQSVQVLVKAGERVAFKAYPTADNAQILRTVVWASDLKSETPTRGAPRPAVAPE